MDDEELMRILEAGGWNPCTEFEKVPHYNNIVHCGDPANYGDVDVEEVMISKTLIRYGTNFTVDAHGDSMIGAGIWDGCTLMIRRQQVAEVGDIVLALIDSDEMTVKSYMEDEDGVAWLVPCNDKYEPMCMRDYPNAKIIGKVVNIERKNPRAPYNDCMKRVREAQKDKPRKREYTMEQLRNALHAVMEIGLKNRHWYAIYRVMVDESIIDDGDYEGFQAVLFNVLGDEAPKLNLKDLSSNMAIGSFRKRLNEWDPENAPVTGKRFYAYLNVGKEFKRCLK